MSIHLQTSEAEHIVLEADFPNTPPEVLFSYWTESDKLILWWPQEAALEPREGGSYTFMWPGMGWRLGGRITRFEPPHALGFTWRWTHEPDLPERQVEVRFEPQGYGTTGTTLTVTHGPYTDSEDDRKDRQSHLDGWLHFLRRLQEATGHAVS